PVAKALYYLVSKYYQELNLLGCGKEVLEIRLRQGLLQAGCVEEKSL
ncbi:37667_t:CDS:2, partial [Gigaspora margarita]